MPGSFVAGRPGSGFLMSVGLRPRLLLPIPRSRPLEGRVEIMPGSFPVGFVTRPGVVTGVRDGSFVVGSFIVGLLLLVGVRLGNRLIRLLPPDGRFEIEVEGLRIEFVDGVRLIEGVLRREDVELPKRLVLDDPLRPLERKLELLERVDREPTLFPPNRIWPNDSELPATKQMVATMITELKRRFMTISRLRFNKRARCPS